jgi:hypothetical protein
MSGENQQSRQVDSSSTANWTEDDFIAALGHLEALQKEVCFVLINNASQFL